MNELFNISGHICRNCNEINTADYIIGLMVFIVFILISKLAKYLKAKMLNNT